MTERPQFERAALRARDRSRRSVDAAVVVRFPRAAAAIGRFMDRLPLGSRLRRALVWRVARLGVEAYNRRDLEVVAAGFDPELEYYPYREFVEAGLAEPCYHGPGGYVAYIESTEDVWGGDVRLEPTELIDLGDRLVMLADMPMRAQASGVALSEKYAFVATLKRGRIVRQQDFLDQAEALRVAGLGGAA